MGEADENRPVRRGRIGHVISWTWLSNPRNGPGQTTGLALRYTIRTNRDLDFDASTDPVYR